MEGAFASFPNDTINIAINNINTHTHTHTHIRTVS